MFLPNKCYYSFMLSWITDSTEVIDFAILGRSKCNILFIAIGIYSIFFPWRWSFYYIKRCFICQDSWPSEIFICSDWTCYLVGWSLHADQKTYIYYAAVIFCAISLVSSNESNARLSFFFFHCYFYRSVWRWKDHSPGDVLETAEDRATKDARTRELVAAYKKKNGLKHRCEVEIWVWEGTILVNYVRYGV